MLILEIVHGSTSTNRTGGVLQKGGVCVTARDRAGVNIRMSQRGRCTKRGPLIQRTSGEQAGKAGACLTVNCAILTNDPRLG